MSTTSAAKLSSSTAWPTTCIYCWSLPASFAPADAVRVIKARSSTWVRGRDPTFVWQSGYAAFSVSQSRAAQVRRYIARQREHHTCVRFGDELVSLLKRHQMEYDERYLLG